MRIRGDERILIVRLGAMGDIVHALPAVESLKRSFPGTEIHWIVKSRWMPLLEENAAIGRLIPFDRGRGAGVWAAARVLRGSRFDLAIDLQGLMQSALIARFSGARETLGLSRDAAREPIAAMFYSSRVQPRSVHIVDRQLEVMRSAGANEVSTECSIPRGTPEGKLPAAPFVLASPFAGWPGKQWPLEHYAKLAEMLADECRATLVLNVSEQDRAAVEAMRGVWVHCSSIAGLIDATRRASAVVGLDSGPLHLAAALRKPGVALFGPTDPARNGPVGGSLCVLRHESAVTTYKRQQSISPSLRAITPEAVFDNLAPVLRSAAPAAGEYR